MLVDFGVARSPEPAGLTAADEVVGTALYIAPEQVSKDQSRPATDVYALGAVAYHCLAGHPPFLGDNPVAIAMQHLNDAPPPLPADVPPRCAAGRERWRRTRPTASRRRRRWPRRRTPSPLGRLARSQPPTRRRG